MCIFFGALSFCIISYYIFRALFLFMIIIFFPACTLCHVQTAFDGFADDKLTYGSFHDHLHYDHRIDPYDPDPSVQEPVPLRSSTLNPILLDALINGLLVGVPISSVSSKGGGLLLILSLSLKLSFIATQIAGLFFEEHVSACAGYRILF